MLEVGIKAPDFELPDQNGKIHRLSDYTGKKVILMGRLTKAPEIKFLQDDNKTAMARYTPWYSEKFIGMRYYQIDIGI